MLKIKMITKKGRKINEHICRLCLKLAEKKLEIDEISRQIFDILFIKLELGITKDPIVCQDCMDIAKKCLNFKNTCITIEEIIISCCSDGKGIKHNIKVIYEERNRVMIAFDDDFNVCRFCMTRVERNNFVSLDALMNESTFEMLPQYMAEMDFSVTRNPVICQDCMEVGKKCLRFKFTCIDTEKIILSYSAYKKEVKHNIKFIYEERNHRPIVFDGHFDICRLCMTRLERINFISFDTLMNERMFEMFPKYMVEMDFNTIENPIICANCIENLEGYVKFLLNCLDVEEKLKALCVEKGTDRIDKVTLGDELQLMLTDILEYPDKCSKTYKSKQGHIECAYPEAYKGLIKQEELDIKDEGTILDKCSYRNTSEFKLHKNGDKFLSEKYNDETKSHMICLKTNEQNTDGHKNSNMQTDKHATHTYEKTESENMKTVIPNDTPDFKNMYQFSISNISDDWCVPPMFKCSLCSYESKHKYRLQKHTLVHKDISEINMFKCSSCTYESKYKDGLKSHMLIHEDVSEIKMFNCSFCGFESKHRGSLKAHMMLHKDASEIKMFKCSLCTYESKRKRDLICHMKVHKDVSVIKVYKGKLCSFECKRKPSLERHTLIHKDVSELKMFKCPLCTYETKSEGNLNTHMIVHKDVSEMKMLKCKLCSYKCKRKVRFNKHMLVHKDDLEIKMLKALV